MVKKVLTLIGTKKGAFILESDAARKSWNLRGPYCDTWPIMHMVGDPETGAIYAGGGNEWFGPAVWKSTDLGETWTHTSEGLAYKEGETPVKAVWTLAPRNGQLYAGVEPAGLFVSEDKGQSWQHVRGLSDHPTREQWQAGGIGLVLHSIIPDRADHERMWVGISAVGVFQTEDGGKSWTTRNKGTRCDFLPDEQRYPEFGQCVHCVVQAAGMPNRLYQQNHCGMYRSDDGGKSWISIEEGLPSSFGFPAVAHPRDADTLYLLPLNGDIKGRYVPDGKAAVWRTRDGGRRWEALREGLPQHNAFLGVMRQAMATDRLDPAGIYFGTSSGALFASNDEGDGWTCIAEHLPSISSVETLVVDG
jgi:photosystem II stability/assembly factor-like uncharacterized protein